MNEASRGRGDPFRGIPGLQPTLSSRLKALWRRSDDRLRGHQELLLASILLLPVGLGTLVLVRIASFAFAPAAPPADPDAPTIAFEGEIREADFPKTKYRPAEAPANEARGEDGASKDLEAAERRLPRIDWEDPELRRRAASLTCLEGDLPGSLRLLLPDDPDRKELLEVPAARHAEVLKALPEAIRAEERRLAESSGPTADPADDAATQAGSPRSEATPDEGPSPADLLRRRGEALPEGLLFRFAVNLHCALRERTGASDAHLRLILEMCFPPRSPARKLYLEDKDPRPAPYGSAPAAGPEKGEPEKREM